MHPLFRPNFTSYLNSFKQLEDRVLYIVNNLRQTIIRDRIDLEALFQEIDLSGKKQLSIQEYGLSVYSYF